MRGQTALKFKFFLIIAELATLDFDASVLQDHILNSAAFVLVRPSCGKPICTNIVIQVLPTVFKLHAPFPDTLRSHYALALPLYQFTMNFDEGKKCFSAHKPNNTPESVAKISFKCTVARQFIL